MSLLTLLDTRQLGQLNVLLNVQEEDGRIKQIIGKVKNILRRLININSNSQVKSIIYDLETNYYERLIDISLIRDSNQSTELQDLLISLLR